MLSPTLSLLLLLPAADVEADYVIRGATLFDGSGQPGQKGDLAIKGERIVAVGAFRTAGKPQVIDGTGLVAAPGFIDLHSHSDIVFPRSGRVPITEPELRSNRNFLFQGVTTIVTGNCGFGPVDVAAYFKKLDDGKAGTNVVHLMPHNDLRKQVMGMVNRPPTAEELARMKALVEQGMKDGAWGLSTGLYYSPGSYAALDEIVALAEPAAAHGGIYASHLRDEGAGLLAAITEALDVGRRAKLPVHISHIKSWSPKAWGKAADAIALIERARAEGQQVTADQYPYIAASTSLFATVVPARYQEGGPKELLARLQDPEQGPKARQGIEQLLADWEGGKNLRIALYPKNPQWQGKDLAAIAAQEKKTPLELFLDIERNGGASVVLLPAMKEEEVRLFMKQPWVATASDGGTILPSAAVVHPRFYGTFPRKIGRYAIEEKVLPLEQAIRSASGLPADILRLPERGYLKAGYFADVVVFDPATFRDTATYDKPHQYATGVRYLFVNGVPVLREGKYTEALPGRALQHPGKGR
jgi:N-acyl-D-aspartate/D-glutamate deacylase